MADKNEYIDILKLYYGQTADTKANPTGATYKNWTVEHLRLLPDRDIHGLQTGLPTNASDMWQLMPDSFSRGKSTDEARAEFGRALLREGARRGIADDNARSTLQILVAEVTGKEYTKIKTDQIVDTKRASIDFAPPGVAVPQPLQKVQLSATALKVLDEVKDCLDSGYDQDPKNNGETRIRPDVAASVAAANGLKNMPALSIQRRRDSGCFVTAYALGSMPQFDIDKEGVVLPIGLTVLTSTLETAPAKVAQIFSANKTGQVSSADAAILGFLQGRLDSKTSFESMDTALYKLPQKLAMQTRQP
ncbi:MAG: hypothetical protein V4735_01540 [Pseudomonadota bacterium]